ATDTNVVYFFFSSRRRHTRSKRDWSSDVCSSDLIVDRSESRKEPEHKGNARAACGAAGNWWRRECPGWRNDRAGRGGRRRGGDAHDGGQAVFAIENIAHWSHARRTHSLAAIAAVTDSVHIGMDGTIH